MASLSTCKNSGRKSPSESNDPPRHLDANKTSSVSSQQEPSNSAAIDVASQPEEMAESEAEGHMRSETDDLKRQAKRSWLPGEGAEILIGDSDIGGSEQGNPDDASSSTN